MGCVFPVPTEKAALPCAAPELRDPAAWMSCRWPSTPQILGWWGMARAFGSWSHILRAPAVHSPPLLLLLLFRLHQPQGAAAPSMGPLPGSVAAVARGPPPWARNLASSPPLPPPGNCMWHLPGTQNISFGFLIPDNCRHQAEMGGGWQVAMRPCACSPSAGHSSCGPALGCPLAT